MITLEGLLGGTVVDMRTPAALTPAKEPRVFQSVGWTKTQFACTSRASDRLKRMKSVAVVDAFPAERTFESRFLTNGVIIDGVRFLVQSIRLDISDADGDGIWVVSDGFSTVYGDGDSAGAAVEDYLRCLAEHFLWESDNADTLGSHLQAEFAMMSQVLARAE